MPNDAPQELIEIKKQWREAMARLPQLDLGQMHETLLSGRYHPRIPEAPLRPEGFVRLFGVLQRIRSEFIDEVLFPIERHHNLKVTALKSIRKVALQWATGSSVSVREGVVEDWLTAQIISTCEIEELKSLADLALSNIDSAMMQLNRQYKSLETATHASLFDPSMARDIEDSWGESDDLSEAERSWLVDAGVGPQDVEQ